MKGPSHINISSDIYRAAARHHKQNAAEAGANTAKGPGSFSSLLAESIEGVGPRGDYPHNAVPMDRDQALKLYEVIQVRMNDSLVRALSESDENNTLDEFNFDWMENSAVERQVELYVSKIQQATPQKMQGSSRTEINNIIAHASKTYKVDPDLVEAVVRAESDFNVNCTSSKGAKGLMQLMPETAKELGVKDSYDPVENIMAGTRYLKGLLDRYDGNVALALAAYNWGMGNLERHPERLPRETQTYIARVNNFLSQKET